MNLWDRLWSIGLTMTFLPTGGLIIANLVTAVNTSNTRLGLVNIAAGLAAGVLLAIDERSNLPR